MILIAWVNSMGLEGWNLSKKNKNLATWQEHRKGEQKKIKMTWRDYGLSNKTNTKK